MNAILTRAHREVLQQFAWSNVLLAFDYDGTLAPIVPDPARAAMRAVTRRLLAQVATLYPCIVVSSRSQAEARRWLAGTRLRGIVGSRAPHPRGANRGLLETVGRWVPLLGQRLSGFKGLRIENKPLSVAVHYRRSREKKRARAAIVAAAQALSPLRVIEGKQVVNLIPEGAPHKGLALEHERERLRCDTAIYVGDDESDEDVFGLDQPGRLLAVRVGRQAGSQASYYVKDQAAVDDLLAMLVSLRQVRSTASAAP